MPVGRPWVTRRENAPQNIDYSALWSSSRCPEIHAVKAMYLYLFLRANLEDQTASVFIETRCSPSVSTAGEQFAPSRSRVRDRLHLQIVDKANQLRKTLISRHDIGRTQSLEGAFRPSAVLTTFYHFISESAWVLYRVRDSVRRRGGTLPCDTP